MCNFTLILNLNMLVRDRLQILLLALREFKQINYLLFPPEIFGNPFGKNFKGNRNNLIHLNLLNIRNELCTRSVALE